MKTTILLLSVDEAPMLAHSLPAALAERESVEPELDVLVVDNASSDGTAELVGRLGCGYLRLAPRVSYAAALNRAIAVTEGDAVLLLNADCILYPGFMAAALPWLAEPGVGSVAPKLVRLAAPGEELGQIDAAGMFVDRRRKNGLVGFGRPAVEFSSPADCFGADGAAALYRLEALRECALGDEVLDEDLELWASDADLAWRARLLGWRCAYEPMAVAGHIRTYSPATRGGMSEAARRMQFRNRYLMMAKNETPASLIRHAPWIIGYEVLALGHVLLRERYLLRAYREAWGLRHGALRRRRPIQAKRKVDVPPFGLRPPA